MSVVRGCIGLLGCGWGLTPVQAGAEAAAAVHARVDWAGPCEDHAQLAEELKERGIAWLVTPSDATESSPFRLSVKTRMQHPSSRTNVEAHVELSDATGGHETRIVEVAHCGLLHPALALILASFAERVDAAQRSPTTTPSGPTTTPPGPTTTPPDTRPPAVKTPRPATLLEPPPRRQLGLSLGKFELRNGQRPASKFGELQFGTQAVAGLGWGGGFALGMVLQFEWQPLKRWPVRIAGGYAHLPTPDHAEGDAEVRWLRRFGRIVGIVESPIPYVKLSLGAEWGSVQASALSLATRETAHASWYALTAMPRVEVRLIGHTLFLQGASGLALAPLRYTLKYADTERVFARTSQLEWRAELGLSVQLASSIP